MRGYSHELSHRQLFGQSADQSDSQKEIQMPQLSREQFELRHGAHGGAIQVHQLFRRGLRPNAAKDGRVQGRSSFVPR